MVGCASEGATEEPLPPAEVAAQPPAPDTNTSGSPAPTRRIDPSAAPAIMSQTFEDASPECNDWAADGAVGIRSIPAHSGDYACKLCATGDQSSFSLARAIGKTLEPGRYAFHAWIRTRPLAPAPGGVRAVLEAETEGGVVSASQTAAVGDDYTRVDVTLDLGAGANGIRARIEAPSEDPQPCILVDDVNVVRLDR